MAPRIYRTLAKIVGIVLILVGVGAFAGGKFAHSFIADQLGEQAIEMPDEESIAGQVEGGRLTQEDADALKPFAGQPMTTGDQAKAFANHYIGAHMRAAGQAAGIENATYSTVGDAIRAKTAAFTEEIAAANPSADEAAVKELVAKEIANANTTYPAAKEIASLTKLRIDTFLDGNTLRGMLLNAYGWGLLGTIALYAGVGLIIVGALLTVFGFIPAKKREEA